MEVKARALEQPLFNRRERGPRLSVLVVEDDPVFAAMVLEWLKQSPQVDRSEHAGDLEAALVAASPARHDVVLLDLDLPDSKGLATLEAVLQRKVPTVVLTGATGIGTEAVRAGAQDYVYKGHVDPDRLIQDLRFALERSRVEKMHEEAVRQELKVRQLAATSKARSRLLATVSSELAPLLQGLGAQLRILGPDRGASDIARQLADLERMVADLRDLGAVLGDGLDLAVAAVDLSRLVGEVVERWDPVAAQDRISLEAMIDPSVAIRGDPARLQQVLHHVLHNAVRFTPGGGRILMTLESDEVEALLEITDTGVGMSAMELEEAFSTFLEHPDRRPGEGRRLGLAISRAIIQAHQGTITVTSDGEGQGTTVRIRLPLQGSDEAAGNP